MAVEIAVFFGKLVKEKTGNRHLCIYPQAQQKPRAGSFNKGWVSWVCNKEGLGWQRHMPTCELSKGESLKKKRSASILKDQEKNTDSFTPDISPCIYHTGRFNESKDTCIKAPIGHRSEREFKEKKEGDA